MAYDRFNVRSVITVSALALAIVLIFGRAAASEELVPDDVFVSSLAEVYYKLKFRILPRHAAMAIGPAGVWVARAHRDTQAAAEYAALQRCRNILEKSQRKSIRKRKCYLYAVNDEIVFKGKSPRLPLGTVLPGEDIPLKRAIYNKGPKSALRGILLLLHGCNRVRSLPRWTRRWIRYFRNEGFRVVVPNSFAEPRQRSQCDRVKRKRYLLPSLRKRAVQDQVSRFRVAQTYRTVRVLRKQYPGLPILIWGHSEGAIVARYLSEGIAGVFLTGNRCEGCVLFPRDIPYLAFIGSSDPFIVRPKSLTLASVRKYCNRKLRPPEWGFVYLKGVGHFPSIRSRKVRKAVDKFIARSLELHGRQP
jgi:hypothetical protein